MRHDFRWKGALILCLVLIFGLLLGPLGKNIFKTDPIRLGLDLKGGIQLLLKADYRLGEKDLTNLQDELTSKMTQANITIIKSDYLGVLDNNKHDGLVFTFANANDIQRAKNLGALSDHYKLESFGNTKNLDFSTKIVGNDVELSVEESASDFPADSLDRSLAIIQNRISEASSGMAEADVRLDQNNRINVQLPGLKSLQDANDLITATGRLTFRIDNRIVMDGTDLSEISTNYDPQKGYGINFTFKGKGSKQFEQITSENVGKKMGVYLDETQLIEPVIQTAISGSGRIDMPSTPKAEVDKDALLMKSGALPISLKTVQSDQVAPTLGKEIIRLSVISGIIGILLVMMFMFIFYRTPGLLADAALLLFALFDLGIMAVFRGVLTLPGIAGFILTMGIAVDANIIIFERIKDELRNGKRVRAAVESGSKRALITILDCNATVLIASGVLYFFGTGPVQGFAVTLAIGVFVSMFTAVFVTRFFLDWRIDHDPDRYAKYFGDKEVLPQ